MQFYDTLNEGEELYKRYYEMLPEEWERPIAHWGELVERFHRHNIMDIPGREWSNMKPVLTEEYMFEVANVDVLCFHNLRYCPPFVHSLEFIKIIYVWRGRLTVYLNDTQYEMTSGNFCVVTPGIVHTVFSKHDEDVVINILMKASSFATAFSGILMEQNILSDFFWKVLYTKHSNRMLMFACPNDVRLDGWIERIYDESARGEKASNLLLESYVMIFLGHVMRDHLRELETVEQLNDEVYTLPAVILFIKENLSSVTIEALARQFGMKEGDLKHYINRESGYSFAYLLKDLRLRKSAELLKNTELSMERIMEAVGYSNRTSFYHTFKDYFGKTPHEYRQEEETVLI